MTATTSSPTQGELMNGDSISTLSGGLFSSASIQAINVFHEYCGNIDILTMYVWWNVAATKEERMDCARLRYDYKVSAVRLTRSIKSLVNLKLIDCTIDKTDARRKIVFLTHKGKALKHDIIKSFTP